MTTTRRLLDLGTNHRSGDGRVLLGYEMRDSARSAFRIYDRQWQPLTPLLRVDTLLAVDGTTRSTFLARVMYPPRGASFQGDWAVISANGAIRAVADQPRKREAAIRVRGGDIPLPTIEWPPTAVYRPARDRVFYRKMPGWYRPFSSMWIPEANRSLCAFNSTQVGTTLRTSMDSGRTWRATTTDGLPAEAGPRVQWCWASQARVVAMTSSDLAGWVHTLDRTTGHVLSSHRVGGLLDEGAAMKLLPNGILVATTNRRGLLVGEDPTNQSLEFRPGPISDDTLLRIVGDEIVATTSEFGALHVSEDAGRSWQHIDLDMPTDH